MTLVSHHVVPEQVDETMCFLFSILIHSSVGVSKESLILVMRHILKRQKLKHTLSLLAVS